MNAEKPEKPEKTMLAGTPETMEEVAEFCLRASTPADAMAAALMAWNLCVAKHAEWDRLAELKTIVGENHE